MRLREPSLPNAVLHGKTACETGKHEISGSGIYFYVAVSLVKMLSINRQMIYSGSS